MRALMKMEWSASKRSTCDWKVGTSVLVFVIFGAVVSGQNATTGAGEKSDNAPAGTNKTGMGNLCETDNDEIGQRLGCSCVQMTTGEWKGSFSAECINVWIGYNDTLGFPPYLNISSHVRKVDFSRNYLSKIDGHTFGDCHGVYEMSFYKNHLEVVHNLNCSRLKSLDLSWNRLHNLTVDSFKNLPKLTRLDLSHNNLVFFDHDIFSQLKNLRYLSLNSNPIGEELFHAPDYLVSFANIQSLEELDLGNTSILDFPLSLINGTKSLKKLKLNNNNISFIPGPSFDEMINLEELDLSGNLFETIPAYSFVSMTKLKTLILNRLPRLRGIEANAFSGLTSLFELQCKTNYHLIHIDEMAFRANNLNGECKPKEVSLSDNNLNYLEFTLLSWKDLEFLDLSKNPWVCDCNLQWVSEYTRYKTADAAMLMDGNFQCYEPDPLKTMPVSSVDPEFMLCYSPAATVAGTVGIIVFCVVLVVFITIIALGRLGILPQWLQKFNVCGSGERVPKYTRVHPKPSRSRRMEIMNSAGYGERKAYEPSADLDLEWDNGDIGTR